MVFSLGQFDAATTEREKTPAAQRPLGFGRCFLCDGDGALPIEPIHDGGLTWTVAPCDLCDGTGVLRCTPAEQV